MDGNDVGLSALPDDILIHILSLSDSKSAVRTCVLSSRWRYLWSYTTRIHFPIDMNLTKELASKYDKFFLKHQSAMLECLNIGFRINSRTKKHVVRWLHHTLASKKVQEVRVSLAKAWRAASCHHGWNQLPFHLFNCQSIITLDLTNCCLESTSCCSNFSSLKTLRVLQSSSETISGFLSTCSSIESCNIKRCNITNISAPRLKSLVIEDFPADNDSVYNCVEIFAPNLEYMKLKCWQILSLQNVKRLSDALLDCGSGNWLSLLPELANVRRLKLNRIHINKNELQTLRKKVVPFKFHRLEDLSFCTNLNEPNLHVLDFLLYSSPNLQLLELRVDDWFKHERYFCNDEDILSAALPNLKRVHIKFFRGTTTSAFQLIQFLLQKACVLELLKVEYSMNMLPIVTELSSMPRISPQVKIETCMLS